MLKIHLPQHSNAEGLRISLQDKDNNDIDITQKLQVSKIEISLETSNLCRAVLHCNAHSVDCEVLKADVFLVHNSELDEVQDNIVQCEKDGLLDKESYLDSVSNLLTENMSPTKEILLVAAACLIIASRLQNNETCNEYEDRWP